MAEMIVQITEAGATPQVIAVAVACFEQMSGTSPGQVRDIARKYERERKAEQRKKAKQDKAKAEANDAASAPAIVPDIAASASPERTYLLTPPSSNSEEETSKKVVKLRGEDTRARGTRLSEGQPMPDEYRTFAIGEGVADPDALWVEFIDYWIGVPGARGTKANWFATWRNNVRRVAARGKSHGKRTGPTLADSINGLRQFSRGGN